MFGSRGGRSQDISFACVKYESIEHLNEKSSWEWVKKDTQNGADRYLGAGAWLMEMGQCPVELSSGTLTKWRDQRSCENLPDGSGAVLKKSRLKDEMMTEVVTGVFLSSQYLYSLFLFL